MKPILQYMGKVTRVLSWEGYREPFMCVGTCTASDIRSYDDAFLMNIQNFLFNPPKDSIPDKNSLMSLINHTFFQHNRAHYISSPTSRASMMFCLHVLLQRIISSVQSAHPKPFLLFQKSIERTHYKGDSKTIQSFI